MMGGGGGGGRGGAGVVRRLDCIKGNVTLFGIKVLKHLHFGLAVRR